MKNVLMTLAVATTATACALVLTAAPLAADIVKTPVTPDGNVAGRAPELMVNSADSPDPVRAPRINRSVQHCAAVQLQSCRHVQSARRCG